MHLSVAPSCCRLRAMANAEDFSDLWNSFNNNFHPMTYFKLYTRKKMQGVIFSRKFMKIYWAFLTIFNEVNAQLFTKDRRSTTVPHNQPAWNTQQHSDNADLPSSSFLACNSQLRSAIRRHHPPQRAVLSQICCFGECKVVLFQILLDGAEPRDAGTT